MARKFNKKRPDGRIAVQVYLGMDNKTGKRKYKVVYGKTQKEADEKALELKLKLNKGIDVTAQSDTFKSWADRWLKIKAFEVSAKQLASYKSCVKHLKRHLESVQIFKIKTTDIQMIILELASNNPNTNKPTSKKCYQM